MDQNHSQPPQLPKKKKLTKTKGCLGCLGIIIVFNGILFVIGLVSLGLQTAKFEENRDEIMAKIELHLDRGEFQEVVVMGEQYSFVTDPAFLSVIERAKNGLLREAGIVTPFRIVATDDTSLHNRKRGTWTIVLKGSYEPKDVRATAVEVAKGMTRSPHNYQVATVLVAMHKDDRDWIGVVRHIPDGLGNSGASPSEKWRVDHILDSIPTKDEVRAKVIWYQNADRFRNQDENSNDYLILDEDRLKRFIAEKMDISVKDVESLLLLHHFESKGQNPKTYPNYSGEQFAYDEDYSEAEFKAIEWMHLNK